MNSWKFTLLVVQVDVRKVVLAGQLRSIKMRRRRLEEGLVSQAAVDEVRASSAWVASHCSHVTVDSSGIEKVVETINDSIPMIEWDFEGTHYFDNGPVTVQYLLVLDALNFCFWPDKDLSYDHLALGLKAALQNDKSVFDADCLQKYTGSKLRKWLILPRPFLWRMNGSAYCTRLGVNWREL